MEEEGIVLERHEQRIAVLEREIRELRLVRDEIRADERILGDVALAGISGAMRRCACDARLAVGHYAVASSSRCASPTIRFCSARRFYGKIVTAILAAIAASAASLLLGGMV